MQMTRKSRLGFSLIEMLVVLSIVLILSGIFIGYNRTSGKHLLLYTEQAKVVGVLNEAKSYAIQRLKATSIEDIVSCAYGVDFDMSGTYRIFRVTKDINSDVCGLGSKMYIKTYKLDSGVRFVSFPPSGVAFEVPYLTTHNAGTVKLSISGTTLEKDIEISQGGAITPQ